MGFTMSVPYLGLTRKADESGKHKAYGESICKEAGYERASKSKTLDRSLSDRNVYVGYRSGQKLWDDLEQMAADYKVEVEGKTKTGETVIRRRGLRKDAIVGFAVIFKPPAEIIRGWDRDTRERFFADCHDVARELEPELFQESNIRMRARHCDEVRHSGDEHEHVLGVPLTFEGHYNGSDMLNHMRRNFNDNFARCMRERGWDMDDLDLYDPVRAKNDPDYQMERRAKRAKQGKSVNDYAEQEAQRKAEEATQKALEAEQAALSALREQQIAEQQRAIEEAEAERVKSEREAIEEKQRAQQQVLDAQAREQTFKQTELNNREAVVEKLEDEAEVENDALDARAESLDARESQLDERERAVSERESVAEETISGAAAMITEYRDGRDRFLDAYESIADVNTTKEGVSVDDVVDAVFNEGLKLTREIDRNRQPETIYNGRKAAGADVDWLSNAWGKVANFFRTMTISGVKGIDVLKGRVRSALGLPADYHLSEKMAEALREGQESRQHDDEDPFDMVLSGLRGRGMRGKKTSKKKTTQARQRYQNKSKPGKPGQQLGS